MTPRSCRALALLIALSLAGCPAPPMGDGADLTSPPDPGDSAAPPGTDGPMSADLAGPSSCGAGTCGRGETCAGAPGCRNDFACTAGLACTKDLQPYCGCDGMTFRGSGNCPGRPYLRRGECGGACVAQEARGVGPCDAVLGVFYAGGACQSLSGCRCEGRDCKSAYPSLAVCQEAHRGCGRLRADGAACSRGDECQSGTCEGMGCGPDEARCMPRDRGCTRDLVEWCGCDGVTFRASSSCPGRPYKSKGRC